MISSHHENNFAFYALLLILLVFVPLLELPVQSVFAWTYEDRSWWFGPSFDQLAGNMGITMTYPDSIYPGDDLDVAISLEYIKNENARSNYVVFSDVMIHVRDAPRIEPFDVANSDGNISSSIIRPSERFTHVLTIPAPKLANMTPGQEYGIDLSFSAIFSRSTFLETHFWDSGLYYFDGTISAQELQNISVVPKSSGVDNDKRMLVVTITRPYATIKPISVSIDGKSYSMESTNNVRAELSANRSHSITIPQEIELFPGTRAVFVTWSDSISGNITSSSLDPDASQNVRNVTLDKNKELFAIYKTQYSLEMTSEFGTPKGVGWHDSDSNAAFSVDPLQGAWMFRGFDKWEGDYSGSESFGTILMDGPKTLHATWKFETTFIAGILGAIAAFISLAKLLPPLLKKLRT